ncbi:hypothetical protein GCM10007094_37730 [Pseudovibrio japonicus]|uniref:Uncharacterized protein n=1 Tax=Pseudovibrio japonicus TaxID=366534 RepID=A0ABQ3EL19_9HYPH|nr:hypothetical protein GCM10007094_37730 [Pseudovibrio japonicus]
MRNPKKAEHGGTPVRSVVFLPNGIVVTGVTNERRVIPATLVVAKKTARLLPARTGASKRVALQPRPSLNRSCGSTNLHPLALPRLPAFCQ